MGSEGGIRMGACESKVLWKQKQKTAKILLFRSSSLTSISFLTLQLSNCPCFDFQDQNVGLVMQCLHLHVERRIQRVAKTYTTLSLHGLASILEYGGNPNELQEMLVHMVSSIFCFGLEVICPLLNHPHFFYLFSHFDHSFYVSRPRKNGS